MKVELTAENQFQSSYPQDFSKGHNLLRGSCGHGCQIRFDFITAAFKLGRLQNWLRTGLSSTNVYNNFATSQGTQPRNPWLALESHQKSSSVITALGSARSTPALTGLNPPLLSTLLAT